MSSSLSWGQVLYDHLHLPPLAAGHPRCQAPDRHLLALRCLDRERHERQMRSTLTLRAPASLGETRRNRDGSQAIGREIGARGGLSRTGAHQPDHRRDP